VNCVQSGARWELSTQPEGLIPVNGGPSTLGSPTVTAEVRTYEPEPRGALQRRGRALVSGWPFVYPDHVAQMTGADGVTLHPEAVPSDLVEAPLLVGECLGGHVRRRLPGLAHRSGPTVSLAANGGRA
jgi:hypothetical protein